MNKSKCFFVFLTPIALMFISAWSSSPPPTPIQTFRIFGPIQIANGGRTLEVASGTQTNYNVDVSGLYVDFNCANNGALSDINNMRVELLEHGCARITGASADPAELAAQAKAKTNHVGLWSQPSGIGKLLQWIKDHKLISIPGIGLVLAVLASPWLRRFVRWIIQVFFRRKVIITIAGAASAGKTGIWLKWKDEYSRISDLSPTADREQAQIEPVMLEKWTLRPVLVDAAGAEPWHVLRGIQSPRWLKGVIARRRTKRVLLFVVAPNPKEGANGNPFDASYINKQEGYAHLPMAIIRQRDPRIRPDLVMMFATKFDLLSKISPKDSDGMAVTRMETEFNEHRRLVESACKGANIPFVWLVGSAKRDWSINDLSKNLARVIK